MNISSSCQPGNILNTVGYIHVCLKLSFTEHGFVFRSAFFLFCNEVRPLVRKDHPEWSVGDVAKELGKRWEKQLDKSKYEALAEKEKKRYEKV